MSAVTQRSSSTRKLLVAATKRITTDSLTLVFDLVSPVASNSQKRLLNRDTRDVGRIVGVLFGL